MEQDFILHIIHRLYIFHFISNVKTYFKNHLNYYILPKLNKFIVTWFYNQGLNFYLDDILTNFFYKLSSNLSLIYHFEDLINYKYSFLIYYKIHLIIINKFDILKLYEIFLKQI